VVDHPHGELDAVGVLDESAHGDAQLSVSPNRRLGVRRRADS
jgi:hypothetical protein